MRATETSQTQTPQEVLQQIARAPANTTLGQLQGLLDWLLDAELATLRTAQPLLNHIILSLGLCIEEPAPNTLKCYGFAKALEGLVSKRLWRLEHAPKDEPVSLKQEIMEAMIQRDCVTYTALAHQLRRNPAEVRAAFFELANEGLMEQGSPGLWRKTADLSNRPSQ